MKTTFRFAPDILRRLGEELNPSFDQGILELVKNAYDADAFRCRVALSGTDRAGGTVVVSDDGRGMSESALRDGWLVVGHSSKSTSRRTPLGRIPAGNKGLGRLAALRLGRRATLTTTEGGEGGSSRVTRQVSIDWQLFDSAPLVEDVALEVSVLAETADNPGTRVEMEKLHKRVSRMDVKRLARSLILLADPFGDDPAGFQPTLTAPEFADLESLVGNRYFQDADYHLDAHLEGGLASARLLDWKGDVLFEASHEEIRSAADHQQSKYDTVDADFEFWAFLLTSQSFAQRPVSVSEVRSWLEVFGGVHLYMNGLRVSPYGNAGNDWLDINLRRAQSPEERPSTNNSIGRITLMDEDDQLVQKTDRSGFIEDDEFAALRLFAQDCLEWMARKRLGVAEARRRREREKSPRESQSSREQLEAQISRAPKAVRDPIQLALSKYDRARQRETDTLKREVQLYRTLSTAGITAATYAHESSGNPLKVISQSIRSVETRSRRLIDRDTFRDRLRPPIESIKRALETLSVLSSTTLRLVAADKRRVGRVDLDVVVEQAIRDFEKLFSGRDVRVSIALSAQRPYVRATEAAIESIITNLLNNALTAFEDAAVSQREIVVTSEVLESVWQLQVSDNGPGVQGITRTAMWLPGETSRPNGTGLGLTIVRDATSDLGGAASYRDSGPLAGATFLIEIPIIGVGE